MDTKRIFLIIFITLISLSIFSRNITISEAKRAAKKFYYERFISAGTNKPANTDIINIYATKEKGDTTLLVFNFTNKGFVILSYTDLFYPVLGYSLDNNFDALNQPIQLKQMFTNLSKDILLTKQLKSMPLAEVTDKWNYLLNENKSNTSTEAITTVGPLLKCKWGQDQYYNAMCPVDKDGPDGHVYVGCTATAMAQIMYYYRYPNQGVGTHTNYTSNYGNLTVNFGTANYKWNQMLNTISGYNDAIAELQYHCSVAVSMNYSPTGSGAGIAKVATALKNYYKYDPSVTYEAKSQYTDKQWNDLIRNNLDNKHPMVYAGYDTIYQPGHAFVCDGYTSDGYYHFDWGWSGVANGYFYLVKLNPNKQFFSVGQEAIVNIFPLTSSYPDYCSGNTATLNAYEGSFEDGSSFENYKNNVNCKWLIDVPGASYVNISFPYFDTQSGKDFVKIYKPQATGDTLLYSYSGSKPIQSVEINSNKLIVEFTSNSDTVSKGWEAEYFALSCKGTKYFYNASDTIDDGSGTFDYTNNLNCNFYIKPTGAKIISLKFLYLNTETSKDILKISDPGAFPSINLGSYSGTTLPGELISNSGEMMLKFTSNSSIGKNGFKAYYTSSTDGINDLINKLAIAIYPNPASDNLKLTLMVSNKQNISISLVNTLGQIVINKNYKDVTDNLTEVYNIKQLPKGIYTLVVNNESNIISRKIIIQ